LSGTQDIAWQYAAFIAVYALMQFLITPLLATWSDAIGRRPVLLISLGGSAIDYAFMAFSPNLVVLLIARCIAGGMSANLAVASAYLADVTEPADRGRAFGQLRACFSAGFLAGPVVGGGLSGLSLHAPFIAAMAFAAANLCLAVKALPEPSARSRSDALTLNPFEPFRWVIKFKKLYPLIVAEALLGAASLVGGTIWVIYMEDRFGWQGLLVGVSLAAFGFCSALSQGFATGMLIEKFGAHIAVSVAILADIAAYLMLSVIQSGWLTVFALPLFCLGAAARPALQSIISNSVTETEQGKVQGVLSSLESLTSVGGPFVVTYVYYSTRATLPGTVWAAGAFLYLVSLVVVRRFRSEASA